MSSTKQPPTEGGAPTVEGPSSRARHARRGRLYLSAVVLIALVVGIVLLALDNRNEAQLSWVFGSTRAPVVWIVIAAAVVGWLAGVITAALFRHRTRAR